MGNPTDQHSQRGHFFRLDQFMLGLLQVTEGALQLCGSCRHFFFQRIVQQQQTLLIIMSLQFSRDPARQ